MSETTTIGVFPEGAGLIVRCSECGTVDYVALIGDEARDAHAVALHIAQTHSAHHLPVPTS